MLIHWTLEPKPPIVNQDDCAVVHIFMDGEPRHHDKGRIGSKVKSLAEFMTAERKRKKLSMRNYRYRK